MCELIIGDKKYTLTDAQSLEVKSVLNQFKAIFHTGPTKTQIILRDHLGQAGRKYYLKQGQISSLLGHVKVKEEQHGLLYRAEIIQKKLKQQKKNEKRLQKYEDEVTARIAAIEMKNPEIEKIIGYEFKNKALLVQAFIAKAQITKLILNSGSLEYIGDCLLWGLAVRYVVTKHQNFNDKGQLSLTNDDLTWRVEDITSNDFFAECISKLNLKSFIVHKGKYSSKIYANVFEAIIGAIAIDCNYDGAILEKVFYKMAGL